MAHITTSNDQEEIYENETEISNYISLSQRREDEETYCEIRPTDVIQNSTDNPRKGFMCNSKLHIILTIVGMVVLVVSSSITTAIIIKWNMDNILMDMTNEIQSLKRNKSGYLVSNNHQEITWSQWSPWGKCSATCNGGINSRRRTCDGEGSCSGNNVDFSGCNSNVCSSAYTNTNNTYTAKNWGSWKSWSSCTATCGGGLRTRTRLCNNLTPSLMVQFCQGSSLKTEICATKPCHGIMFSAFSVQTPNGYVSSRMTFSSTIFNNGDDYRTSTGTFTCSKPGVYYFAISLVKKRVSSSSIAIDQVGCWLYKGSSNIFKVWVDPKDDTTDEGSTQAAGSTLIHLNRNEYVYLGSCHSSNKTYYEPWSSFSGFLVNLDD